MSNNIIFHDEFMVEKVNPDGKKFEKVSRLICKGILYEVELLVDINSEIFEIKVEEKLGVAIARNLSLDGSETYEQVVGKPSLLDQYDYAMHGVAYKYKHVEGSTVEVHVSHGGLLARLKGDERHLAGIKVDDEVYTLIRRIEAAPGSSSA
ncbi:hypothetical protein CTAYLR_006956 [Chrysophaeum taylorii]|uniref:DNA-directed RNA polymerases I, II, and III subunit RPABC3 n=1 Tax=Chrysophaeum taylorii TaxID=2483200 RepID=A0AAD7UFQ4_9STRA|nr:hypothetical protein CTAYLR_006956 [Chrysophaeum taylorii]